jgi:hypothetical protein
MIKRSLYVSVGLLAACLLGSCSAVGTNALNSCPRVEFGEFRSQTSSSTRPVRNPEGRTIFFERTPIFSLLDISKTQVGSDGATVLISVKADAAERLKQATTGRSGATLAFVVDDEALMAVVWEGDYGLESGDMQLSFRNTDVARKLAKTIERCTEEDRIHGLALPPN